MTDEDEQGLNVVLASDALFPRGGLVTFRNSVEVSIFTAHGAPVFASSLAFAVERIGEYHTYLTRLHEAWDGTGRRKWSTMTESHVESCRSICTKLSRTGRSKV